MAAKAKISTGWKVRVGAMGILLAGMSGWFLMDGFVGYPAQEVIYLKYVTFVDENKALSESDLPAFIEKWNKKATAEGLPPITRDPKALEHYHKEPGSILTQKILGFAALPVALIVLFKFLSLFKMWIATEEDGVHTHKGERIAWDTIEKLDKTRWPRKGISFLHYKGGDVPGRLRIDDFWYDREPTDQIIRDIESHLTDEQIIGDIRETERDKRKAEKKAAEEAATKEEPATTPADA